ncbi:MAG: arginase family protein [Veillonella sp.]|nr:arginase family protein [Veillonella sp.]
MSNTNTLRLVVPDWQAGNKPQYFCGSMLLKAVAPMSDGQKEVVVPIKSVNETTVTEQNGVVGQAAIKEGIEMTKAIIAEEKPERIITLGGNCIVSQAPFDYLHGLYGEKLGVIWFDAHPDISNPSMYNHEHAMVLANLLKQGDADVQQTVDHPFQPKDVLYVGLQPLLDSEVDRLGELGVNYEVQTEALLSSDRIQQWVKEGGYTKVAIHWDLDVLNPKTFHSLYFNEPGIPMYDGASCGRFELEDVTASLKAIQGMADVVGFTVAEYLPWDAIRLHNALAELKLFQD